MSKSVSARVGVRDYLWCVLFGIIFVNGFESGGYQASLLSIGETFDLSITSMGLIAALELFTDMLAPVLLGHWADRCGKGRSMTIMCALQVAASVLVTFAQTRALFLVGMFCLGLTTSALQFIAIACLADAYPQSAGKRIGYLTSMYALGAVVAPLAVSFYLSLGVSWRALFVLLALCTAAALFGIVRSGTEPRERAVSGRATSVTGALVLAPIIALCVVMCLYVGFENGFSFFVDTLFTQVFASGTGKLALSLYWASMIPARMLVGKNADRAPAILLASTCAIPIMGIGVGLVQAEAVVLALCVPLGLASGAIYPCVLNLMLPFAGTRTATATGMITAATGIGGCVFTALTGVVADAWGLQAAYITLSVLFSLSILAVIYVRRAQTGARG